nr:MAG TPA: hypothetical protein [Caudoviricetes sp.]
MLNISNYLYFRPIIFLYLRNIYYLCRVIKK